jgi:4-hydroxybenzoyl-CoA thioesterase
MPGQDAESRKRGRITTHGLLVYVALGADGEPVPVRPWTPVSDEDKALDHHAQHLVDLRRITDS